MPSSSTPPKWRRAFLRVLGQCANVTASARAAGVDKSTVYQYCRRNPHFARLMDDARERARAAIASGQVPDALPFADTRPRAVRSSKTGKTCVMQVGEGRWSAAKEEAFLAHLAATANVKASARAIGMSDTALYNRRRKWPAFDAAWAEAKAYAADRLNLHLIEAASNVLHPPEVPPSGFWPDPLPVSVDQAIRIVQLNNGGANRHGAPKRHDWRRKPRDPAEIRAAIIRKLDIIERHERG